MTAEIRDFEASDLTLLLGSFLHGLLKTAVALSGISPARSPERG